MTVVRAGDVRILREQGIPADAWFVCFHVREGGFYKDGDDPYARFRNADIHTFAKAVERVRCRGGYVVRVGDASMTPYPETEGLFDYAVSSAKSDWMDVFLCAACRFFIGSTSGLYFVPTTFGVPCVLVNWASQNPLPWEPANMYIPKLVFRGDTPISFREMLDPEKRWIYAHGGILTEQGLRTIDNSADEIADVVEEMIDRLSGSSEHQPGDAELQIRFEAICGNLREFAATPISTKFLRRHAALLD